jgi:predicted transcriptional regulator
VSLARLVGASGFARQTVHSHLKHLVRAGLVSREVAKRGRGRPTILYRLSKRVAEAPEGVAVVALTFQRLKHACRFEKGGRCKEVKDECAPENCPLTLKPR